MFGLHRHHHSGVGKAVSIMGGGGGGYRDTGVERYRTPVVLKSNVGIHWLCGELQRGGQNAACMESSHAQYLPPTLLLIPCHGIL